MVGQMGYHHDVSWASVEWTRLLKIIKKLGQNNEDQPLLKDSWESPPVDILLRSLLDIDVNGSYFIDRCGGYSGFLLFDYGSL